MSAMICGLIRNTHGRVNVNALRIKIRLNGETLATNIRLFTAEQIPHPGANQQKANARPWEQVQLKMPDKRPGGGWAAMELIETLLDNLIPGDLVLADRGFTVHKSVQFHQAKLNIPAFTKGKDQLDSVDVGQTRKIATVRIHVERIIGLLRPKYTILQQTLPTE